MCAFDESKYLDRFKNHVATLTDYNNIKILDFKKPDSNEYRIRFLFEEDYCRLHITGDIGDLIACNYNNMCFDKFGDFVNNTGYFEEKVDCHSKPFHYYDEDLAREQVIKYIEEHISLYEFDSYDEFYSDEENLENILNEIFENFTEENGIDSQGLDMVAKTNGLDSYTVYEWLHDAGKKDTDILELYMLAFKLAMEQLKEKTYEIS